MAVRNSENAWAVILAAVMLCGTGCTSWRWLPGHRQFPLHPEYFEVRPGGPYNEDEAVDFHAVYFEPYRGYDGQSNSVMLRFWPNGRVIISGGCSTPPTVQEADSIRGVSDAVATVGYYQVNGTNVVMEWFGYQGHAIYFPDIGFTREWAVIDGEDLIILEGKTRELFSRKYRIDRRYKRLHIDGLTSQPDW